MNWWPWGRTKRALDALRREFEELKNSGEDVIFSNWEELFGHHFRSIAGPVVSSDSAMKISAAFACVRLIASCVSSCPCLTYKGRYGVKGERKLAWDHPRAPQLRLSPCPSMTASTFWKHIIQHKLISGNAYAVIKGSGLHPVRPERVIPYQAWEIGMDLKLGLDPMRLLYYVQWDTGRTELIDQADMLHFSNLGWDGKQGLSTIRAATQNLGLAMAQEDSAARFYGQGAQYDVVLKYPNKMTKETADRITDAYMRKREAHRDKFSIPLVLQEGGDISQVSMSARDAQMLEARQYSVIDVCRWFGVPPVMIGESEKTSSWGTGVEQVGRWFVTYTLNDHFTDIEQELERKLFGTGRFFAEFDESELTRGDTKARGDFYRIARGSSQEPGFMTIEEIRIEEGRSPKPEIGELQKTTIGEVRPDVDEPNQPTD